MRQGLAKGEAAVGGAQAIRRAIDVIRTVARLQRTGANLGRVAHATSLNQSTAFRILRSLTEERMLYYNEVTRSYHLGLLAFELGLATAGRAQILDTFRPVLEDISRRTRLTTYLMARSDNEAVCLACAEGAAVIRAKPLEVGQRLPLGIGAGSVALLSTLDDDEIADIIATQMPNLDLYPGGRDEIERIFDRIAGVRQNGFSVSTGSVAKGVSGIGVPVLPRTGLLQLAISVSAVTDDVDPAEAKKIAGLIHTAIHSVRG